MKGKSIMVIVSILGTVLAAAGSSGGIFPYEYRLEVLDNGLSVIMIPTDNPGLIAYYSIVRTGSRDEWEKGHTGFAHFFEHMMFRGTEKYPSDVYDRMMTEMGADANAYTTEDYTCYHIGLSKDDLEKVFELESDRFQNLSYSEQAFKTEAGAVHGEYLKSLSNPFSILEEKLLDTAFQKHTYKHTVIGFREDIESMPTMYDYSKSFFKRYYRPENVVLLIVGDIEPAHTLSLAKIYYGGWVRGYVPPRIETEPEQRGEKSVTAHYKGETLPILTIAYKGLAFDPTSVEMASCYLLGDLAFGPTSDIYTKLVIQEQRVEYIAANFSSYRDPHLLTIYTMIKDPDDINRIRSEIYYTIKNFQDHLVAQGKLDAQRSNVKYSFLMNLDTPDKVAGMLAEYIARWGIECIDQLFATMDRVKPEDIQKAAQRYLLKDRRTVVVLTGGN